MFQRALAVPEKIDARARERTITMTCSDRDQQGCKKSVKQLASQMVDIPGAYLKLGKYAVTQALWEAVMETNPSWFKGADRPVDNVSRNDCQEFIRRLNIMPEVAVSGLTYRLPTEDEWEYACRAGSKGRYCKLADGTEITKKTLGGVAWYKDNSEDKTHSVRQKRPNAFGLHDMLGNVWEWTASEENGKHVCRGGGYSDRSDSCTAKARKCFTSNEQYYALGFRLAADAR